MSSTLADRLRIARERAALSQAALGRAAGISAQAIQHIESGASQRTRFLTAIAGALGVTPQWLESGEPPMSAMVDFSIQGRESKDDPLSIENRFSNLKPGVWMPGAKFSPEEIPAALARPRRYGRKGRDGPEAPSFFQEIAELNQHLRVPSVQSIIEHSLYYVPPEIAVERIPTPHYLRGQIDAYAIIIDRPVYRSRRFKSGDILHVSKHKITRRGDSSIIWLKNNDFLILEEAFFFQDDGLHIRIRGIDGSDSSDYLKFEFQYLTIPHSFLSPSLDTITGVEFAGWSATQEGREREDQRYQEFLEQELRDLERNKGSASDNN